MKKRRKNSSQKKQKSSPKKKKTVVEKDKSYRKRSKFKNINNAFRKQKSGAIFTTIHFTITYEWTQ
jgi:hypothetical protein